MNTPSSFGPIAVFSPEVDGAPASVDPFETAVRAIVAQRGKQHNPVTGSGGMLLGRIERIGSAVSTQARVGDR